MSGARRPARDHGAAHGIAGTDSHGVPRINDASGVRTEAAPGRSGTAVARHERRGNGRWRARLVGAAAARERTAEAGRSALVRSTVPGAVRSPVQREARTGDARGAPGRGRGAARSRRSRRRASEARAATSAPRAQRAEARGIAAEIGAKRRLQRKARSRSDAPRFVACIGEPVSIFGTVITITVCTIAFTDTIGAGIVGNSTDTVDRRDARLRSGRA